MEQIILALEREKSCWQVKEILESSGTASCRICTSAAQVRRMANKFRITTVVCSYKLVDQSAEVLAEDLPPVSYTHLGEVFKRYVSPVRCTLFILKIGPKGNGKG